MTEMLYLLDCYGKEFEAIVTAVRGDEIELDRTFFYPESGGQPSDLGTILVNGKETKMVHARKEGDGVWHKIEGKMPSVGDRVRGVIDWTRRYTLMRYHTALHVLSRILYDEFRAGITGNQIGLDKSRMDFATDMYDKERISYIEEKTNLAIAKNYPIKLYMLPRQEAMTVIDQNRTRIDLLPTHIDAIRIVEIVGYDFEACGGTHLSSTGEIGKLRIAKIENKGKNNKRMEIVLE
jgi:misacylated tRNA(Ala) deacylase